jgi:hypothetical protein
VISGCSLAGGLGPHISAPGSCASFRPVSWFAKMSRFAVGVNAFSVRFSLWGKSCRLSVRLLRIFHDLSFWHEVLRRGLGTRLPYMIRATTCCPTFVTGAAEVSRDERQQRSNPPSALLSRRETTSRLLLNLELHLRRHIHCFTHHARQPHHPSKHDRNSRRTTRTPKHPRAHRRPASQPSRPRAWHASTLLRTCSSQEETTAATA